MNVIQLTNDFSNLNDKESPIVSPFFGFDLIFESGEFKYEFERPYSKYFVSKEIINEKIYYLVFDDDENGPLILDEKMEETELHRLSRSNAFTSIHLNNCFIKRKYGKRRRDPSVVQSYSCLSAEPDFEIEFEFSDSVADGKELITLSVLPIIISRLNKKLEFKWQREFNNEHPFGSMNTSLFDYKNSVISNLGCTDGNAHNDGEIISLYKDTGETKWSAKFDHLVHSCIVVSDQVYVAGFNFWYVLNANTGDILQSGDVDLGKDVDGEFNSLWSDGEFLYFTSMTADLIRVYKEKDGEHWGDIKIPEGYKISFHPPKSLNGFHYFSLGASNSAHVGNYYGVLMTSAEEIRQGLPFRIVEENYENINIKCLDDGGGQFYQLSFEEYELGHILRFGQIESQKLAASNTYNLLASMGSNYANNMNKKFNGSIRIRINKNTLKEHRKDKLDLMCELINKSCEKYIAPHAKEQVIARWEWL